MQHLIIVRWVDYIELTVNARSGDEAHQLARAKSEKISMSDWKCCRKIVIPRDPPEVMPAILLEVKRPPAESDPMNRYSVRVEITHSCEVSVEASSPQDALRRVATMDVRKNDTAHKWSSCKSTTSEDGPSDMFPDLL